jgi:hypothetical protein
VTHGTKIVDFIRFNLVNESDQVCCIAEITIMKINLDSSFVTVSVDMVDTTCVETRRTTDDSMDLCVCACVCFVVVAKSRGQTRENTSQKQHGQR